MAAVQRTTKQQILDAVQDLHNTEQMVTREALRELTGLANAEALTSIPRL